MSDRFIDKYVDLIGVLIITATLSYVFTDVSRNLITEEVGYPGPLILQIVLVHVCYLSVFLAATSFDKFLNLPRWFWVSVVGSFATSLVYLEPLIGFDIDRSMLSFVGFSFYSVFILGGLNFKGWAAKLLNKHSSAPISLFPQGGAIRKP